MSAQHIAIGSLRPGTALAESVVDTIRAVPGVADAAGSVEGYAQVVDESGRKIGGLTSATVGRRQAGPST